MSRSGTLITVAAPSVWPGMVRVISSPEAPLKVRAAGPTLPVGLGIGRLVRALDPAGMAQVTPLALPAHSALQGATVLVQPARDSSVLP